MNFARTGDPNGPGLPSWPRFTREKSRLLDLGAEVGATDVVAGPLAVFDAVYDQLRGR